MSDARVIDSSQTSEQKSANKYFAAKEPVDLAGILTAKAEDWYNSIESSGFLQKLRASFYAYHGSYYASTGTAHQITFSGEQGELAQLPVNQYRNIATHILVMTTSNRPSLECRAANTDYKSLVQTYRSEEHTLNSSHMSESRMPSSA